MLSHKHPKTQVQLQFQWQTYVHLSLVFARFNGVMTIGSSRFFIKKQISATQRTPKRLSMHRMDKVGGSDVIITTNNLPNTHNYTSTQFPSLPISQSLSCPNNLTHHFKWQVSRLASRYKGIIAIPNIHPGTHKALQRKDKPIELSLARSWVVGRGGRRRLGCGLYSS